MAEAAGIVDCPSQHCAHIVAIIVEQLQGGCAEVGHGSSGHRLAVPFGGDAQHLAIADDGGAAYACLLGQCSMLCQEGVLPMHRQEVLWLHYLQDLFKLVPAATPCLAQGAKVKQA